MPLYEYECEKCGFTFEMLQKLSEEPMKLCPDPVCDGDLKKVVTRTNFELKGSGWARDGYK